MTRARRLEVLTYDPEVDPARPRQLSAGQGSLSLFIIVAPRPEAVLYFGLATAAGFPC